MRPTGAALLKRWHQMLNLSRQSPSSWYRDRLREELQEHRVAKTSWQKLSEASDVFFSISRAQYDGFPVRNLPPFNAPRHILVYAYMLAKYTLRWKFYRTAATKCNAPDYDSVREVVNPSKDRKLEEVASRHQIDPAEFKRVGRRLRQTLTWNRNRDGTRATAHVLTQLHRLADFPSPLALFCCLPLLFLETLTASLKSSCAYMLKVGCRNKCPQHADWLVNLMIGLALWKCLLREADAARKLTHTKGAIFQAVESEFLSNLSQNTEELTRKLNKRNNSASAIPDAMAGLELEASENRGVSSASDDKAIIIGLYGVSGCGKSYLLKQLEQQLGDAHFVFYDGSKEIEAVFPGDFEKFKRMKKPEQEHWRKRAIEKIGKECTDRKKVGVVAGHFMFWSEERQAGTLAWTDNDARVFTHILYLDIGPEVVEQRTRNDSEKERPIMSARNIYNWQHEEKIQLSTICRQHGILFSLISPCPGETTLSDRVSALVRDFKTHDKIHNLDQAEGSLDQFIAASQGQLRKVLVLDADKTLAPEDTGVLFWEKVAKLAPEKYDASTLKTLFSGPLGHTYTAFRQAVLLYEEAVALYKEKIEGGKFDDLCQEVASAVTMHPEFVSLLKMVAEEEHVGAVVVTSGLRRVWLKVLEREGLSKKVEVIGGGRIEDGFVVSAAVKGALVARLREVYKLCVWAFGDSPLDLEMLCMADRAVIVVGEEQTRSATMDEKLTNAIDSHALRAEQVLLPGTVSPRLDKTKLPLIKLTERDFVKSLLGGQSSNDGLQVFDATDKSAAKLLATPMRDAAVAGPNLRQAHRRVGHYLAIENLPDVVGIEPCPIQHVQDRPTIGFRLFHEQQTTIVALMRGGEPMALGVNDAFPRAMFVHAHDPEDLSPAHLNGQITVILVDSVVNTGKTIVDFVQHVRQLHATIRIVVVAGVVQDECVKKNAFRQKLALVAPYGKIYLVALRLSETNFVGTRATDTGNRLFNTTHMD